MTLRGKIIRSEVYRACKLIVVRDGSDWTIMYQPINDPEETTVAAMPKAGKWTEKTCVEAGRKAIDALYQYRVAEMLAGIP